MSRCFFNEAWLGQCKSEALENSVFCTKHNDKVCSSCGFPAVKTCDETMGSFICGEYLCCNCEHTINSNGFNSMGELPKGYKAHCKKGTQVYTHWYERSTEEIDKEFALDKLKSWARCSKVRDYPLYRN